MDDLSQVEPLLKNEQLSSALTQLIKPTHERRLASIYHSVPWSAMNDASYIDYFSKFAADVRHIVDCPESNLPSLGKSKASNFTDRIKMICPRMFPVVTPILDHEAAEKQFSRIQDNFKTMN